MTMNSTRHGKPQADPTGHVGPKAPSDAPLTGPEGHVGPKILPTSPLNLGTLSQGSSAPFNITMTNSNDTDQNWTWQASTPGSSVMVNTPPDVIQANAQETISATVNTTGLAPGTYSPGLTFTFTQVGISSTVTIQFTVN